MATEAKRWKKAEEKAGRLPLLEWSRTPNNRRFVFIIRRGDPRPADPLRSPPWWGACMLEVEWSAPGEWDWRVWPRLARGTGSCIAAGTAPTAIAAKAAAAKEGLASLEDLLDEARTALERSARVN